MTVMNRDPFEGKTLVRTFTDEHGQECREYDDGTIVVRTNEVGLQAMLDNMAKELDEELKRQEEVDNSEAWKLLSQRRTEITGYNP